MSNTAANQVDTDSDEARLERHRQTHSFIHPDIIAARRAAIEREQAQREDTIRGAVLELTAALGLVDSMRDAKVTGIAYETMQRSGFKRKNWTRPYTLADAKRDASNAAIRLRNAWELLEPMSPAKHAEAHRTALANTQEALQTAVQHLQSVLNKARAFDEQQRADTEARDWLASIGSDPA